MALPEVHVPERMTSTDQAYQAVLAAILDGSIPPGAALPLQELASRLGMSMMPVREAIRQLEATGVVEVLPHRGARVRSVSEEDLEDTYRARIAVEGLLVAMAAERFTEENAAAARKALDNQQLAIQRGDPLSARQSHEEFHHSIYRAAGSQWLFRSISAMWNNAERYRVPGMIEPESVEDRRREHEEILSACEAHDPERAKEALRQQLLSTVRHLNPAVAERLKDWRP